MRIDILFPLLLSLLITSSGSVTTSNHETDGIQGVWELINIQNHPSKRYDFDLDYDSTNDIAMLFGGSDGKINDETWVFNPQHTTWTQVNSSGPNARSHSETVYVSSLNKFVLYGGVNGTNKFIHDMWLFDSSDFQWSPLEFVNHPIAGQYHRMAYVPTVDAIFSFGGVGIHNNALVFDNNMWMFNLQNNTWLQLDTDNKPLGRLEHSFYYDPVFDKLVLYGGESQAGATLLDDTWLYDYTLNTWTEINTTYIPYQNQNVDWSGDLGYATDPVFNITYVTRDYFLWYLDIEENTNGGTWIELESEHSSLDFVVWGISSGMTYIDSIDKFLVFGGYDFYSPATNNYLDTTATLTISWVGHETTVSTTPSDTDTETDTNNSATTNGYTKTTSFGISIFSILPSLIIVKKKRRDH